jgi:hypothetical protein
LLPAQLEKTVREIAEDLQQMAVTPHVRELRAKAVTYGRVIGGWVTYAPTPPQIQAMLECVSELEQKVQEAKRDGSREVSRVSRRPGGSEPVEAKSGKRPMPPPLPSAIPPGVAWNASVPENSGVRQRKSSVPAAASRDAPTRPPPALSGAAEPPSLPPVSAPRTIETPVPALLRSRQSR